MSILCFLFFNLIAQAAPHPASGSSVINSIQEGSIFSQMGFKLNAVPEGWSFISRENPLNSKDLQIDLGKKFSVVNDRMGRISFKSEWTLKKINLETYVKKFLRDYNQFGFEVAGLQSLREKNSIIVDVHQKNKKTRSRQMFFQNGNRIVTATCIDEFENFDRTIKDCNLILNGLRWK